MNIWEKLSKPIFILAPMDDVTDTVFRRMVAKCAKPDLFFTEFANVDGYQSPGRVAVEKKLRFYPEESPLIAQLWGVKPDNFYKTVQELATGQIGKARRAGLSEMQGSKEKRANRTSGTVSEPRTQLTHQFAKRDGRVASSAGKQASPARVSGIDLNMGCPVKNVMKAGACAALMQNHDLASEIIKATQLGAGKLPVSIKTRLGMKDFDESWLHFLLEHKPAALAVHFRSVKELSKIEAHWDLAEKIVKLRDEISPKTLIIGNGDVISRADGQILAAKYQLDGIMIGRGIFQDPFVFSKTSPWPNKTKKDRIELFKNHIELFAKEWGSHKNPAVLKKFAKVYINGFNGAKELREQLMQANTAGELLNLL